MTGRVLLLGLLAAAAPAAAQVPTLDRVDSLVTAGAYAAARESLDAWWSARQAFDVPGSDRARALMLRAQLQAEPDRAEVDYLAVVLGYPTSPHTPQALLRLGQGLLASGQIDRAAGYLQRLVADYPGRPERLGGLLWLARAHNAGRRRPDACAVAREGLRDAAADPDLAAMLRIEEAAACAVGDQTPAETPVRPQTPRPTPPAADRPTPAATDATGRFAVQAGAFRYRQTADALMKRLRDAGHLPRAVLVPRNSLLRIRVGRFRTAEEAARLVATLKRQGFEAVVVGDAAEEREP